MKYLKIFEEFGSENREPLFEVGDLVYSYQNEMEAAPIRRIRFSPFIDEHTPHPNDVYKYKLSLPDGEYTKSSHWINEDSLSRTPLK